MHVQQLIIILLDEVMCMCKARNQNTRKQLEFDHSIENGAMTLSLKKLQFEKNMRNI